MRGSTTCHFSTRAAVLSSPWRWIGGQLPPAENLPRGCCARTREAHLPRERAQPAKLARALD